MSGLDRLRPPENRRWIFSVAAAVLTALAMMLSASWWAGAPTWRLVVSLVVSLTIGLWLGRIIARKLT